MIAGVGALVRRERLARDWSLKGLAHGICAVSYLSKIERGEADPSPEVTGALLDASSNGTLTMTINGSEPIEATISDAGGAKTLTIPAHQEVVKSFKSSATYDIPESVLTLSE